MQPKQKEWLAWILMLLAVLGIALFFGVQYPIPDQPPDPPEPIVELGGTHFSGPLYTSDIVLTGDLTVAGDLQYGDDDLYPVGNAASDLQLVTGTDDITATLQIDHGLTTVTWALCSLGQDATANAATCSASVATNDVTVKIWKADGFTAGSDTDVTTHWLVIGAP